MRSDEQHVVGGPYAGPRDWRSQTSVCIRGRIRILGVRSHVRRSECWREKGIQNDQRAGRAVAGSGRAHADERVAVCTRCGAGRAEQPRGGDQDRGGNAPHRHAARRRAARNGTHRRHRPVDLRARLRSSQPDPALHSRRPGYVAMPTSWYYQRGWEEYFTVVQWDQRGAGKTHLANDPKVVAPTMTPQRMVADIEEMIGWLRKEFDKKKIFVLGHSWGSYLGLAIAQRHPEWLHAYVGMGQMTDSCPKASVAVGASRWIERASRQRTSHTRTAIDRAICGGQQTAPVERRRGAAQMGRDLRWCGQWPETLRPYRLHGLVAGVQRRGCRDRSGWRATSRRSVC